MRAVVVGHTAFTLAMFGLMWAVQIVIYPQFRSVAPAEFATNWLRTLLWSARAVLAGSFLWQLLATD